MIGLLVTGDAFLAMTATDYVFALAVGIYILVHAVGAIAFLAFHARNRGDGNL
jgi:hypothetical protein